MNIARTFSGFVVLLTGAVLAAQFLTVGHDEVSADPPSAHKADNRPAGDRYDEKVARRADRIKRSLDSFEFRISPEGENGKPFFRLLLSVAPLPAQQEDQSLFDRRVRITKEEATRLIDFLGRDEFFLNSAYEVSAEQDFPPLAPYDQNYVVTLTTQKIRLWQDWAWGPMLVKRLRGLGAVLGGKAAEEMHSLISRLDES